MKSPIKYDTGLKWLDTILSAIAYGVAIAGLMCIVTLLSFAMWAHWRIYG